MVVKDPWDRDQWGRWLRGACVRGDFTAQVITLLPTTFYSTEDLSTPYGTEDSAFIYVPEP